MSLRADEPVAAYGVSMAIILILMKFNVYLRIDEPTGDCLAWDKYKCKYKHKHKRK